VNQSPGGRKEACASRAHVTRAVTRAGQARQSSRRGKEAKTMQTRSSWDPWYEMQRLQREMEQLVGATPAFRGPLTGEYPPVNVTREADGITIEALCPGVDRSKLDITVVGDSVAIRGERRPPADVPEERYLRRERPLGAFARTLNLGERLDPERTEASYVDGILRVKLARAPEVSPRKIPIQS
jgi:HSP20 family protein